MGEKLQEIIKEMFSAGLTYEEGIREFKKRSVMYVLRERKGCQIKAARDLKMHRNTLLRLINELGLMDWLVKLRGFDIRPQYQTDIIVAARKGAQSARGAGKTDFRSA